MSAIENNKEIIRKLYEDCLNKKNTGLLRDFISEDYVGIRGIKGVAGFEEPILDLIKGFPDIQWNVEELFGEGNQIAVRWKWKGTHLGQFRHFAITGKTISNDGMAIYELRNGKVLNASAQTDRLGFLQELDVLPFNITYLSNNNTRKDRISFIDKFFVPSAARKEFYERMTINRNIIKKLPGFIEDTVYGYTDDDSNLICLTVAKWDSREALDKARESVQEAYKKQGFNTAEMLKRLGIVADRGIYTEL